MRDGMVTGWLHSMSHCSRTCIHSHTRLHPPHPHTIPYSLPTPHTLSPTPHIAHPLSTLSATPQVRQSELSSALSLLPLLIADDDVPAASAALDLAAAAIARFPTLAKTANDGVGQAAARLARSPLVQVRVEREGERRGGVQVRGEMRGGGGWGWVGVLVQAGGGGDGVSNGE